MRVVVATATRGNELTVIPAEELAHVFVEVADTLVDDFDVVDFLQTVTIRTAQLSGMTSAGLLLADGRGELRFMAASDESARLLELFQVQAQDGPCLDCYRTTEAVVNADLAAAGAQWPRFAPAAVDAGFASVHAFPLRHRSHTIGALNLFDTAPRRLQDDEARIVQALADVATIGLLQERSLRDAEVLAEQLQGALTSRVAIEQAKGMLARIHDTDVDSAFELLRRYARREGLRLSQVAADVVARPDSHPGLTGRT